MKFQKYSHKLWTCILGQYYWLHAYWMKNIIFLNYFCRFLNNVLSENQGVLFGAFLVCQPIVKYKATFHHFNTSRGFANFAVIFVGTGLQICNTHKVRVLVLRSRDIAKPLNQGTIFTPLKSVPVDSDQMMTCFYGNVLRVAGLLWGESSGDLWIPFSKGK